MDIPKDASELDDFELMDALKEGDYARFLTYLAELLEEKGRGK